MTLAPPVPFAARRTLTPVKWWAGLGACVLALIAYLLVAWVASGDATPTDTGSDPVPAWMHAVGIGAQAVATCVALAVLAVYVVRPLWRERRIPFDGLLALAAATMYWQDPVAIYTQAWCAYNADLVNLGSWAAHIPGWQTPDGNRFAEPLLFSLPVFFVVFLMGAKLANTVMARVRERVPSLGNAGLVVVCFAFLCAALLVVEVTFTRSGLYHYGGAPGPMVGGGHYYQFPLIELPMMGAIWTAIACLRYFRDDHGASLAERGIERLRVTGLRKDGLRFLALAGALNLAFLVLYNIPSQWVATHSGAWIDDVTERSYLTDGLCGPGTAYACAAPAVPIARPGSAHLDPAGRLVPATGTR